MHIRRAWLGRLQRRARAGVRATGTASGARRRSSGALTMSSMPGHQVGRSLPRLEARAKVTGRAEYTHTMRLPGMLHAKIFRSTVAHGRIKSIDVSAATKVPGIYRVVTADDVRKVIPSPYYGPAFHDQPIL